MKIEIRAKLDKIEKLGDLEWDDDCNNSKSIPTLNLKQCINNFINNFYSL